MKRKTERFLIVLAHPEPTSYSHAMMEVAKSTLTNQGHAVDVSDLFAMGFDPVNDRRNFSEIRDASRYTQQVEEQYATQKKSFAPMIQKEMDKIEACTFLMFIFPLHWFGLPSMLKGYVDKVFASSFAYGKNVWYDNGKFTGKRAMLMCTTGAPEFMYRSESIQGDINEILYPITHGMFFFCGFQPLKSFVVYSPASVSLEKRQAKLNQLRDVLLNLHSRPLIRYHGLNEAIVAPRGKKMTPASLQGRMINSTNAMMKAWEMNDKETWMKYVSDDIKFVIPAYGVDVTGVISAWRLRTSLPPQLDIHTVDTHSFPEYDVLKAYTHVLSKSTGKRTMTAIITLQFNAQGTRAISYNQNILWRDK